MLTARDLIKLLADVDNLDQEVCVEMDSGDHASIDFIEATEMFNQGYLLIKVEAKEANCDG